jgi:pullulanase/glycogen debranching enzyme
MPALRPLLLALGLSAARVALAADAPVPADCQDPAPWRVLAPAADTPPAARAAWLDGQRLLWPGAAPAAGERVVLLHAATEGLRTVPGQPPQGATQAWTLQSDDGRWPPSDPARWRHFGADAPRWALPPEARAALPQALRGELRLARLDTQGRVLGSAALQAAGALDALYAPAEALDDYGAQPGPRQTRWRLWAPTAQAVALCLYRDDRGPAIAHHPLQRDDASGSWTLQRPGDARGLYYRYLVDVRVPGVGLVRQRVADPYSVSSGADARRSYVSGLDEPAVTPPGWAADRAPDTVRHATDMTVYELHVRDFSRDDPSVPAALRGRYAAFTQGGSQGMRHLRALARAGLTDVHLLPVFDFGSVPETGCAQPRLNARGADPSAQATIAGLRERDCFNWGYDPVLYSAPEGAYSLRPHDGASRLRELRQMVMALHRAGLRVGMDVVYNHTFAAGQHPNAVLDRVVPGYYHRLDAQGQVERSTCCDNTATEHRMMGKLMEDSVLLWARAHHIDSFRFDLMGHQPRDRMERLQQRLRAELPGRVIPLIGEGWNFGEVADGARFVQASQLSLNGSGIGSFNDRLRDAVRGGGAGDSGPALTGRQGWAFGLADAPADRPERQRAAQWLRAGAAGSLRTAQVPMPDGSRRSAAEIDYAGQPAGYTAQPAEAVNYVENHDNQTLFDNGVMKLPLDTPREVRARAQWVALASVAFSQGVAYFHAGGELMRSKSLDRNSYNSGDWFNALDWSGQRHGFARGLPPEWDNRADWPAMRERLADPRIAPTPHEIAWLRERFLELLRIRASTPLLRLHSADDLRQRLTLLPADDAVLAVHLDGRGRADAGFDGVLLLVNAARSPREVAVPAGAWRPHPALAGPLAPQTGLEQGRVLVPAQTVQAWVLGR